MVQGLGVIGFKCYSFYSNHSSSPHINHIYTLLYGVATIGRLLKIIDLFCRMQSVSQGSFAKETYNIKESTTRSHPILLIITTHQPHLHSTAHHHSHVSASYDFLLGLVLSCSGLVREVQPQCLLVMERLRLVGSVDLQVFFAKEPYKRDYILQKRPMI